MSRTSTAEIPRALHSPFELDASEDRVTLARSPITVRKGNEVLDLSDGHIFLSHRGRLDLRFEGTGTSSDAAWMPRALTSWQPTDLSCIDPPVRGRVFAETAELGGDFSATPYTTECKGRLRFVDGGTATKLKQVFFHLVNFPDFVGSAIRNESGFWAGRLYLGTADWLITLDSRRGLGDLSRQLKEAGGFGVTHVARLTRVDGSRFTREAAIDVLDGLHWFLSFVRGAWTSPILFAGSGVRSSKWHHWSGPRVDPARGSFSWADPTAWASVAEAYQGYAARWVDPVWQQALKVAIGQYVSANYPSPVETAIIAAQSGLELLSWMQLVESRLVPEADWTNKRRYPASRKIAELLHLGSIDVSIPPALSSLHGLDQTGEPDPRF